MVVVGEDDKVLEADDGDVVHNASVLDATALYTENGEFYIMGILPSLTPTSSRVPEEKYNENCKHVGFGGKLVFHY